jgi:hypothetical protein
MKKLTLAAALVLTPTLAHAQSAEDRGVSVRSRTRVDAAASPSRARSENRGRAATSANASAQTDLAISHDALVRAGRAAPADEEVRLGARLLARGFSRDQIETVARSAPADRSLIVAFETLSTLKTQGMTTTRAAAEVESRITSRASDAELRELTLGADAGLRTDAAVNAGRGAAKVDGATGVNAAGALGRGTAGVAGSLSGGLGGALGRP